MEAVIRLKYEDLPKKITYKDSKGKIKTITIRKEQFVEIKHRGIKFYFDKRMYKNLERIVSDVANKVRDAVMVFAGPERVGKSFGKIQFLFVMNYILKKNHGIDMPFNMDNIHFSAKDYMQTRQKNKKLYRIDDLDESKTDLDRKNRYEDIYKQFENYLAYCGSEYGIQSLTLPLWSDMGDYTVLHRGTGMIIFKAYRDEEGRALKGIFDVYSIPYYDNVLVRGKTRDEIKEIIAYWYKNKRFAPLPKNIKAMSGVCLDYEIIPQKIYDEKKDFKKNEVIHKNENPTKLYSDLTEREKEILKDIDVKKLYSATSSEYRVLDRLKKKLMTTHNE